MPSIVICIAQVRGDAIEWRIIQGGIGPEAGSAEFWVVESTSHLVVIVDSFQECRLVDAHEARQFFKCVGAVEDAPLNGVLDVHACVGLAVRDHGAVVVDHLETHTPIPGSIRAIVMSVRLPPSSQKRLPALFT